MNSQSLKKTNCSVVWSYGMYTAVLGFTDGGAKSVNTTYTDGSTGSQRAARHSTGGALHVEDKHNVTTNLPCLEAPKQQHAEIAAHKGMSSL